VASASFDDQWANVAGNLRKCRFNAAIRARVLFGARMVIPDELFRGRRRVLDVLCKVLAGHRFEPRHDRLRAVVVPDFGGIVHHAVVVDRVAHLVTDHAGEFFL
jgi:hypothetical protein